MGAYTVLWGLWVAAPWWNAFGSAKAFHIMSQIAPEWVWGSVAIIVGLIMIRGVLQSRWGSLTIGALCGFFQWITVSGFFFWGDWQNTGGVTYLMIAVYCAFIWLNLRVNKRYFDV